MRAEVEVLRRTFTTQRPDRRTARAIDMEKYNHSVLMQSATEIAREAVSKGLVEVRERDAMVPPFFQEGSEVTLTMAFVKDFGEHQRREIELTDIGLAYLDEGLRMLSFASKTKREIDAAAADFQAHLRGALEQFHQYDECVGRR